jgi:hypothetical protein
MSTTSACGTMGRGSLARSLWQKLSRGIGNFWTNSTKSSKIAVQTLKWQREERCTGGGSEDKDAVGDE